jgi:anti-sigma regulatory factor (Ser/Thr protein kinase)
MRLRRAFLLPDVRFSSIFRISSMTNYDRLDLLNTLTTRFDENELESISFALGIDYQSLSGTNKVGKARSLILFLEQRGRMSDLMATCRRMRPDVSLIAAPVDMQTPEAPDNFSQRISRTSSEKLLLLRRAISSKLLAAGFARPVIADFEFCFGELTDNGIEHGSLSDEDAILVEAEVTDVYVTISVTNLSGIQFDVNQLINHQRAKLAADPMSRRGRGLMAVSELADSINSISNQTGVKIVLYAEPVRFQVCKLDGVTIIEVTSGLANPAINSRMTTEVNKHTAGSLILHVPRRDPKIEDAAEHSRHGTKAITHWVDLFTSFKDSSRKLAVYIATSDAGELVLMYPSNFIAQSWPDALRLIGREDLSEQVAKLCESGTLKWR